MANKTKHPKFPSVYIVTPVFNGIDFTCKFLQALDEQDYKALHVIIVDDGSTDGTAHTIAQDYPKTIVVQGNSDLWWSGGTNLGVEYALEQKADYILTINNDVTLEPGYISSIVECAQEHARSLIGSMVVNRKKPTEVWFFGGGYNKLTGMNEHVLGTVDEFTEPKQSTWLTGMGVLIPAEVFRRIGLYDADNFPQYFGDADFSERARRAGYELWVNPESKVLGDIYENWVGNNLRYPKSRFIIDLFKSIRSPYQWETRRKYYKKYWPGNYRLGLLAFYTVGSFSVYLGYSIGLVRRVVKPKKRSTS